MSVTVVSCLYGTSHDPYAGRWKESLLELNRKPDAVTLTMPWNYDPCTWKYPFAFYLNKAIRESKTDWIWVLGVDDLALPDALDGIEDVTADVWQMGYLNDKGEEYIPPQLTAEEYLKAEINPFTGCSAFRRETYLRVGGFPDVALEDWALWRRMAAAGSTFESSGRTHYRYMRHEFARSKVESENRDEHLSEVMSA